MEMLDIFLFNNIERASIIFTSTFFPSGSFSRVLANFQFTRKIMYILMRDYLPAAFIVATSWLSFHINPAASPARVSLAVVTVLSISTQLSSKYSFNYFTVNFHKIVRF